MTASAPASKNSATPFGDLLRVADQDAVGLARLAPVLQLHRGAGRGIRPERDGDVDDDLVMRRRGRRRPALRDELARRRDLGHRRAAGEHGAVGDLAGERQRLGTFAGGEHGGATSGGQSSLTWSSCT